MKLSAILLRGGLALSSAGLTFLATKLFKRKKTTGTSKKTSVKPKRTIKSSPVKRSKRSVKPAVA